MLILEPNPLEPVGHRKATIEAAPNVAAPNAVSVTADRLRNCRRVTPIVSGSGGVKVATSALEAGTTSLDTRSISALCSTMRPAGTL